MNNILSSFRKKKNATLHYILICVPVLSSFSRAKCLLRASTGGVLEQDLLEKIAQLVISHSVTPSLQKILMLHWKWWAYTYVLLLMQIFHVQAVTMHVGSSKESVELLATAKSFLLCNLCREWPRPTSLLVVNWNKTNNLHVWTHPVCLPGY